MYVFIFLGIYLGVEIRGHVGTLCLTFWGTVRLFSKIATPFYISSNSVWGFWFLHIIPNTCIIILLLLLLLPSISQGIIMLSIFQFADWLFAYLLGEMSPHILCPFSNWVISLYWVCESSLYTSLLSDNDLQIFCFHFLHVDQSIQIFCCFLYFHSYCQIACVLFF